MGWFDFLKPDTTCALCRTSIPNQHLNILDATLRGRLPQGEKLVLCPRCFTGRMDFYFRAYQGKAVMVYPQKRFNAYQFYDMSDLRKFNFPEKDIAYIRTLIDQISGSCSKCSSDAAFLWCAPGIYRKDPFDFSMTAEFERSRLCRRCLSEAFVGIVSTEDICFDEFFPPVGGDGLCSSWEA